MIIEENFDFKSDFNNNKVIDTIPNFSNKSINEKEDYIRNLSSAKGYNDFYEFYTDDEFEVWVIQDDPSQPTKAANIIIKINTGEVVISDIQFLWKTSLYKKLILENNIKYLKWIKLSMLQYY